MAKRVKRPGMAPGALVFVGDQKLEKVRIRTFRWNSDRVEEGEWGSFGELAAKLDSDSVWWINVDGLHDPGLIQEIGNHFRIHPLVQEDILNTRQRPKVEDFDDYLFVVIKMLEYSTGSSLISEQFSIILTRNVVLSFQEQVGTVFDVLRERIRNADSRIRRKGPDYFCYRLVDTIVDRYFTMLDTFGDSLEDLEQEVMDRPTRALLHRIQSYKRHMALLRRSVWPLKEMINALRRGETNLITDSTRMYLRDVYDHSVEVLDTIEVLRENLGGMQDIYLSSASNRMNEVMKTLTVMASIFIPLTFVAGIYGMNFNPDASAMNMPELNWVFGYPFALGLMVAIAVLMVAWFKRKHWI